MNITIEEVTQQVVISGGGETTTVNISEEVVNVVQVGTQGPDGARGKSAYEVWLDEGNTGTETDFINFLAAGGDAAVLSVNAQIGEVVLDKTDVGLSNVDNTSDAAKPISTATQTALNAKASSTHTHTSSQVTDFDAEVDNNATVAANTAARHTHANQATLDATTASFTTAKDTKLTSISTGATANSSDATLLSRANHTGAQAISTVTGLQTALDAKQASGDYATNTALTTGLSGKASTSHAHVITDTTGLQTALDSKAAVSHTHTASQVTDFDTEVSNNVDVTANTTARHTHSNSTVLNNTTASFTTADETKLDGIATGATANSSDATLLSRANHTGSQAQSTITNLTTDLAAKASLTGAETLTDKTLDNTNAITLKTNGFTLQDPTDPTKQIAFTGAGITTGTTRTLTVPNANITLLGTTNTATVTGKTISGASNTLSNIAQSSVTNLTTDLAGKAATSHSHVVGDITATGTPSSSTYLRGDGSWSTPAGGGGSSSVSDASIYRHVGATNDRYYVAGQATAIATVTATPAINTLFAVPQLIGRNMTVDRLAVQVTTLAASGKIRVGIYTNTSDTVLYPSALVLDSGELDSSTAGMKTATVSQALTPGLYWFVYVAGTAAAVVRALPLAGIAPMLGNTNALATTVGIGWSVAYTYAALPATFTAGGAVFQNIPPAVGYRLSA